MKIFLNSFYPITQTEYGRQAAQKYNIHPLEDGSIRREPDFCHPMPAISGLCRPRSMRDINLEEGDIMIYKSNGSHYLAAILKVHKSFDNHQGAANWLASNNYYVPTNNITIAALPLEKSHVMEFQHKVGRSKRGDEIIHKTWNEDYLDRGSKSNNSYFFLTEPIYNAIALNELNFIDLTATLRKYYTKIPNTALRPQPISVPCYEAILYLI